jgi:hypothetical protein
MYRLKFEKMVEGSLDVVRYLCFGACGPFILVESILTLAFYSQIKMCPKSEGFTHLLTFVVIIAGCISLALTSFCCYHMLLVGKTIRNVWPEIRNPPPVDPEQEEDDAESIRSSQYERVRLDDNLRDFDID